MLMMYFVRKGSLLSWFIPTKKESVLNKAIETIFIVAGKSH